MDADLIAVALATGASAGVKGVASTAITDTYQELKSLLVRRFKADGRKDAEATLAKHSDDPDTWQLPLVKEISESGANEDARIVAAAAKLLELAGGSLGAGSDIRIFASNSQGVSAGGPQTNTFNNTFYGAPGPRQHGDGAPYA